MKDADIIYTDDAGPYLFEETVDTHMALLDLADFKRHRGNINTTTIVPSDEDTDL